MSTTGTISREFYWERFISIWDIDFRNAIHILHIINSYPSLASLISKKPLQTELTVWDSQKEWIWLCSRLTNPIDTGFFKDYWVPIEIEEYGIYLDLSDSSYPIFSMEYFCEEPYRWYKRYLFKDIKDLLLSPDIEIDIKGLLNENDKERWDLFRYFYDVRLEMGFQGKIKLDDLKPEDLICLPKERIIINDYPVQTKNCIILINISSLIVSLLPPELNIRVVTFISSMPREINLPYEKIQKVSDLVFFLRSKGYRFVKTFEIEIQEKEKGVIIYEDNRLILRTTDEELINILFSKCTDQIKKSSDKRNPLDV